jgi:hypothetical protein
VTAQSGGLQPLVVATFGASTAWCGKTIVFSDGVFFLEDHGPIQAADVLTYEEQGDLGWAYDGFRDWVAQCANDTAAVPAKPVAGDGDQILVFDAELEATGLVVAHNLEFDQTIMTAEFIRADLPHHFDEVEGFCTMRGTTAYCHLTPKKHGEYKWPKLSELHAICTGKPHIGAHDAMGDADAVVRCLRALQKAQALQLSVVPRGGSAS